MSRFTGIASTRPDLSASRARGFDLHHGVDVAVIAMWLGHERLQSTQTYLHADLTIKQRALDRTAPNRHGPARRYQPPDHLIAQLKAL